MAITAGNDILASDYISTSAGSGSSGKVPKLNANGKLDITFSQIAFGGTGADGALSITSGTTTIALGAVSEFIKNYTSISITGTGKLAFSGPATNGTLIVLKSQGAVTLTSSTVPLIDVSGLGGQAVAAGGDGNFGIAWIGHCGGGGHAQPNPATGGAAGTSPAVPYGSTTPSFLYRFVPWYCGGSGGGGSSGFGGASNGAGGPSGAGGGALIIECAGALIFTGTINANGTAGGAGVTGGNDSGGGGGGGGGGSVFIFANTITTNSGTINTIGGAGGAAGIGGSPNAGGSGGGGGAASQGAGTIGNAWSSTSSGVAGAGGTSGFSIVQQNTEFA